MYDNEEPHLECPYPSCGSSDAFSFNRTKGIGKCHSCDRGYPSREPTFEWAKDKYPVAEKQVNKKVEVTGTTYNGIRGIDADVAKLYGIQGQTDADGTIVQYAFKYPTNVKYRDNADAGGDKKFWMKERGATILDLFGPEFNAGSSKRLYLTEGEFDAASLFQILGKTYPVKSLPASSISGKYGDRLLSHNHRFLSAFEQIVYAGELSDEAGRTAAERLYNAYPDKFYFVPLNKHKDANDFLTAGDGDDLKWAALKPQRYSPDNFFCSDDEFERILTEENPYEYVETGHSGLDYNIRGLVKGGVTFVKAPPGSGKTELIRYFERAMLQTDDTKIAMIHMEEMKSTTLRAMATYELGVNVRTKDDAIENNIEEEEVTKAALRAAKGERSIIFEMRAADDPTKIVDYCRLACSVYGAEFVFVDHVQRLTYLSGVDNATNTLTQIASNLAQMCKELNVGIIMISHVNEDGHTKYAKSLEEEAIICIDISRDKNAEDDTVKNTTKFSISKNRPFSRLGDAGHVYFDAETTILEEVDYAEV